MMSRSFALLPLLFAHALIAQVKLPATTQADMAYLEEMAVRYPDAAKLTELTQGKYPTALVHGQCTVGFLAQAGQGFDPQAVDASVVHTGARKGTIVSFRVDAYHLEAVREIPGLVYAELAGKVAPTLDRLVKATRVDSVWWGIDLPQTYTGRNVLIGITDWGFDYTHPMFYDTALTATRIRAAWDQYRQAGPAPAGYTYGAEFTTPAELLAAQADTANVYSWATHGSHVAGICGGGGAGTAYRGVAFDANFLFCTFLVDGAAVLDAFDWMQNIAQQDGKRLVINMSWGLYYIGTLDGHSLISQAIDQFAQEGVVFANSAGNNGNVDFHIKKDFVGDTLHSRIAWDAVGNPNFWGQSVSLWGTPGQPFSAGIILTNNSNGTLQESPWYHTATQQAYLDSFLVQGVDTIFFNLTAEAAHPLNGRPHFRLRVRNTHAQYKVALKATAAGGTVHAWNVVELTNDVGNWGDDFDASGTGWAAGDHNYGIGEPAVTEGLISVAAYQSEYMVGNSPQGGTIANFSSYGPTMDERMKPDITAPGVSVASSISSFTDNDYSAITTVDFQSRTYPFAKFSGTSMSSPAVAGIAALMLEADPTITPAALKELIRSTARTDSYTGMIPAEGSTRWGMGKVNAYHAVLEELGLTGIAENDGAHLTAWPDPATDELNVWSPFGSGPIDVRIMDVTGRTVRVQRMMAAGPIVLSTATLTAGVYVLHLSQDGRSASGRFIKQ